MTTYVFDRHSCYGTAAFLSDLDVNGDYTEAQYERLKEIYTTKVTDIIHGYDDTLIWWPETSEIWGVVGETESDPCDFREWWTNGANGAFENALFDAWDELDKEIEKENSTNENS